MKKRFVKETNKRKRDEQIKSKEFIEIIQPKEINNNTKKSIGTVVRKLSLKKFIFYFLSLLTY